MGLSALFIDGAAGRILLTCQEPDVLSGRAVIVLPAFGEEMNKSRRLVRDTAAQLAEKGFLVVNPDLFGCGDSEGRIEDARIALWLDDLRAVIAWIGTRQIDRLSVLVVRAGAMYLDPLQDEFRFERIVGWQPADGTDTLRDLMRVHSLNLRMSGQVSPGSAEMLEALLENGTRTELSGYAISSDLAADMLETSTGFEDDRPGLEVIRFGAGPDGSRAVMVGGERFWRVLEPGPNDELVAATTALFCAR